MMFITGKRCAKEIAEATEPAHLEPVLRNKRGHDSERPPHRDEEWPPLATTRESPSTETKTQHSHKKQNKTKKNHKQKSQKPKNKKQKKKISWTSSKLKTFVLHRTPPRKGKRQSTE